MKIDYNVFKIAPVTGKLTGNLSVATESLFFYFVMGASF